MHNGERLLEFKAAFIVEYMSSTLLADPQ